VLILRPRALDWDLLLLAIPGRSLGRELAGHEAEAASRVVLGALLDGQADRPDVAQAIALSTGGWQVQAAFGGLAFLVCPRVPGKPYEPLHCREASEAQRVVQALGAVLRPPSTMPREVYLNTRQFARGGS
jgi:hypothetical protein